MKQATKAVKADCVTIKVEIAESEDFRRFMALAGDSYPMCLGRLAALCLDILISKKRFYTEFDVDRVVQWPAGRERKFGRVLESVGWARYASASTLEIDMPTHFIPRRPYREKRAFQRFVQRDEFGRWASGIVRTQDKVDVLLLDVDGLPHDGLESVENPYAKPDYKRRARNGRGPIVPKPPVGKSPDQL